MNDRSLESAMESSCAVPHDHSQDDVSIECIQSSEFVVGKQTNFNGPVTIISCAEAPQENDPERLESSEARKENIVIRDKVVTRRYAAEKNAGAKEGLEKCLRFVKEKLSRFANVFLLIGIGLFGMAAIGLAVFFATESTIAETVSDNYTDIYLFYSKADWGGKPPRSFIQMKLPVPYVVVSHSVTPLCNSLFTCAPLIQNMQNYHFTLHFADIAYNFLVDSSGHIYEGRGWTRRNVKDGFVNSRNIDIGLIGDYSQGIHPTPSLMEGLARLLVFGEAQGYIAPDYALISANSTYSTLSPGKNVYEIIKNWPHFEADPKAHIKEYE